MIQILDLGRADLLAYRVSDILTEEDVRTVTDAFDALLAEHETIHLYAKIEDLRGVEARALWPDLVYRLRLLGAFHHIGRVSLMTDAEWIRRIARLAAGLLPVGRLNVYGLDGRDDARAWVLGAPVPFGPAPTACDEIDSWDERGGLDTAWADAAWFDVEVLDEDIAEEPRGNGRAVDTSIPTVSRVPRAPRFGHTVHRTHVLLRRVADELGTKGTAPAYHALRAVLPALRDRLPDAEAADLAAQLTTIVRGVFYEGYRPARKAEKVDRQGFIDAVASRLRRDALFGAEEAVAAVGRALVDGVSEGQWGEVLQALPQDVRTLFEAPVDA